jgi:hypothetical protein
MMCPAPSDAPSSRGQATGTGVPSRGDQSKIDAAARTKG